MKKNIFALIIVLVYSMSIMATNARIESMGKSDLFFMDDVSCFTNPANVNIYPNFLIGELGAVSRNATDTNAYKTNQDPMNPWFGGIMSFSLNKDKDSESRYPQLIIGGAMNRKNEMIDVLSLAANSQGDSIVEPVVPNSDFFLGYTSNDGIMMGLHFYAAKQSLAFNPKEVNADLLNNTYNLSLGDSLKNISLSNVFMESYIYRFDLGFNTQIAPNVDLEVSGGVAIMGYNGTSDSVASGLGSYAVGEAENALSIFASVRAFSTLDIINGEIVPVFKIQKMEVRDYKDFTYTIGLGANVTLDRGFFWVGLDGTTRNVTALNESSINQELNLSFGIERNLIWDWFVARVGGKKTLIGSGERNGVQSYYTNEVNDGTLSDHVGVGVGLNIDEQLKLDGVIAEDIFYTWGNLISGNSHHVLTRVTATYSF